MIWYLGWAPQSCAWLWGQYTRSCHFHWSSWGFRRALVPHPMASDHAEFVILEVYADTLFPHRILKWHCVKLCWHSCVGIAWPDIMMTWHGLTWWHGMVWHDDMALHGTVWHNDMTCHELLGWHDMTSGGMSISGMQDMHDTTCLSTTMVSTDLLAIESWDFTDKRHGEKNTGLDDSCQNQLLEDHPDVVKWAKNLARTLLPLDGRWVLDEHPTPSAWSGLVRKMRKLQVVPSLSWCRRLNLRVEDLLRILPLLSLLGALAQREWNLKNNECSMHKC